MKEVFKDCFLFVNILFLCISPFLILKGINYYNEYRKFQYVSWCVADHNAFRPGRTQDLLFYIYDAERSLGLAKRYCISEDETQIVELLFEYYKKELLNDYFKERFQIGIRSKYVITEEDVFYYHIYQYLKRQEDDRLRNNRMYLQLIGFNPFSSNEAEGSDQSISLYFLMLVVLKLQYITGLYSERSKVINPKSIDFNDKVCIMV